MALPDTEFPDLAAACRSGDRRAASRLISYLESADTAERDAASSAIANFPLPEQTIGFTGPPGAGKSTLLNYMATLIRDAGNRVAILAIDPSSPFTGGALLGDRIRMSSHRNDSGVFVRSMGTRGASGGISLAASDALRVLAAAGFGTVLLETVGAGQSEIELVNLADTVCVIQVPGLGDDVQLMKMGILEIADIFVVNKGDKPEAAELQLELERRIGESTDYPARALRQIGDRPLQIPWTPPVVLLSALHHENGEALLAACKKHLEFLRQPALAGPLRRDRLVREITWRAGRRFQDQLREKLEPNGALSSEVEKCLRGEMRIDEFVKRTAP